MPYKYNIPQATDQLSISQGDILENFTALGAIAGNGLVPNTSSLNATVGFNFVNFALDAVAPATGANQMALFTLTDANTTLQELYVQKQNSATPVPMTAYRVGGTNPSNGWTTLPSGVTAAWGQATIGATGVITITYSAELLGFPGFTIFSGQPQLTRIETSTGTPVTTNNFMILRSFSTTGFVARTSTIPLVGTAIFSWFVMGY